MTKVLLLEKKSSAARREKLINFSLALRVFYFFVFFFLLCVRARALGNERIEKSVSVWDLFIFFLFFKYESRALILNEFYFFSFQQRIAESQGENQNGQFQQMHYYQNLKGIWSINTKVSTVEALHISTFFKEPVFFLGWPGSTHLTRDPVIKPDRPPNQVSKLYIKPEPCWSLGFSKDEEKARENTGREIHPKPASQVFLYMYIWVHSAPEMKKKNVKLQGEKFTPSHSDLQWTHSYDTVIHRWVLAPFICRN